jgi:hypothetical protein
LILQGCRNCSMAARRSDGVPQPGDPRVARSPLDYEHGGSIRRWCRTDFWRE